MTKPRVIALVSILLSLSCSKKIESTLISRIFNLDSFGILIPDSNNIDSVRNNNSLINTTLDFIGKSGGGTLLLPEGIFYIGPIPGESREGIAIKFDNITLQGRGVNKTILKTNGDYKIQDGKVFRGAGIKIYAPIYNKNCQDQRKNITLCDFELDGQSGFTGNHSFPADISNGDGWDITHKGIIINDDGCLENVTLKNLYIHSFKGELLYTGGLSTGRINVLNVKTGDTNASCFNLHASEMTVNNCSFIGPAMMWMELTARKGQGFNRKSNSYIINSQFVGPVTSNAGVSLVQGDSKEHNYSFLRNNFHNSSNGVFGFYGGVAGSIIIEDNNLDSVGQAMYFGIAPGYLSDSKNKNIIFKNNKVSASGSFIQFYNRVENVTIKENVFRGISQHSTAMIYGNCTMKNILVENNIFYNCRVTEQNASLNGGKRPYFKKNKYINPLFRDSQGKQVISNSNPKVKPISEFLQLYLDEIETIDIDTLGINDGQILQIEILNDKGPGQNLKNRNKEKNTIFYKYNERKGKWILQQS